MILTYFNVSFSCFLHSWARDPGPGLGPKATARSLAPAWPAAALGPGPGLGSRAQQCKKHGQDTLKYVKIIIQRNLT